MLSNNNKSNYRDEQERGRISFTGKLGCCCELGHAHTHSSTLPARTVFFSSAASVFPLGEIVSGKGQKDEIETSPQWLCDYKSTNRTDGGQMGAELTEQTIPQYLVGLMF